MSGTMQVSLSQAPQYRDPTAGLQNALTAYKQGGLQDQARVGQALEAMTPLAQKQTIANTLQQTKDTLDTESIAAIDNRYKQTQLDEGYVKARDQLDAEYKTMESNHLVGYDEAGNFIPLASTAEGKAYTDKQAAFDTKYKDYSQQLDNELARANATTQATMEAGYDPTKLKNRLQDSLVSKGLGLAEADAASTLAAKPYQATAMTELQKSLMEGKISQGEALDKADLDILKEQWKGNQKTTAIGKSGTTGARGTTSAAYKNKTVAEKAADTTTAIKHIQDTITDISVMHPDNDALLTDLLQPLYSEYGDISPHTINNIALTKMKRQYLGGDVVEKSDYDDIRKAVKEEADAIASAKSEGQYVTTGRKGITQDQYNTRREAITARGNKRLADISSMFNTKGNKTTGLSNLTKSLQRYNSLSPEEQKKEEPKSSEKAGSTSTKGLFSDNKTIIGKAMNVKAPGKLVVALMTKPEEFGKAFNTLDKKQQARVTKVLESKASVSKMNKLAEAIQVTPEPKKPKEEKKVIKKATSGDKFIKGIANIGSNLSDALSLGDDISSADKVAALFPESKAKSPLAKVITPKVSNAKFINYNKNIQQMTDTELKSLSRQDILKLLKDKSNKLTPDNRKKLSQELL